MPMKKTAFLALLPLFLAAGAALVRADRAEGSFDRTLAVSGPVQVRVSTGSGGITVRKGPSASVRVQARIRAQNVFGDAAALVRDVEQNPPIRQNGNIITLGDDVQRWNNVAISYDLAVPEETEVRAHTGSGSEEISDVRGPLEASTGSGAIRAEKIGSSVKATTGSGSILVSHAGGAVTASTGSGGIELTDINGAVEAHTGSGGITVIGSTGAVRARAGSGRVRVERAVSDVDAHSASGGVTVDGAPKSARWNLESGSGSILVSLPQSTPFELDAHTGSGGITTSHQLTVSGTSRRNELRGVAIRPDNHIFVRTGSGNVKVD